MQLKGIKRGKNIELFEDIDIADGTEVRVDIEESPSLLEDACEPDPDDTPTEVVIEGLRQGLQEALAGQTIPLAQMWEGIDAE